jgi:amino acid permease
MVVEEFLSGVLPARSLQETTAADVSVHQSQQQQQTWQRRSQFVSRVVIAACALSLGVAARNELGNILSVVGGFCSISTSLILPAAFYAKLSWETHSNAVKMGLGGMFLCGGMLLVQVTYQGAKKLSQ